jgi:hypothetical protein
MNIFIFFIFNKTNNVQRAFFNNILIIYIVIIINNYKALSSYKYK